MTKWLVGTIGAIAIVGCLYALGSREEISSEGKIVQVLLCVPPPPANGAPDEDIETGLREARQKVEDAIRDIPSKVPAVQRVEWGRLNRDGSPETHCLLATFGNPQPINDSVNWKVRKTLREARIRPRGHVYLFHDATPQVRTSIHGRLRRVVGIRLKPDATPDEMQNVEDSIAALPQQIPAIERLEWGTRINDSSSKSKPIDPADRDGYYCLLFTFDSTSARDACLAHPAYQEFLSLLKEDSHEHSDPSDGWEYEAQVEYLAAEG